MLVQELFPGNVQESYRDGKALLNRTELLSHCLFHRRWRCSTRRLFLFILKTEGGHVLNGFDVTPEDGWRIEDRSSGVACYLFQ